MNERLEEMYHYDTPEVREQEYIEYCNLLYSKDMEQKTKTKPHEWMKNLFVGLFFPMCNKKFVNLQ